MNQRYPSNVADCRRQVQDAWRRIDQSKALIRRSQDTLGESVTRLLEVDARVELNKPTVQISLQL